MSYPIHPPKHDPRTLPVCHTFPQRHPYDFDGPWSCHYCQGQSPCQNCSYLEGTLGCDLGLRAGPAFTTTDPCISTFEHDFDIIQEPFYIPKDSGSYPWSLNIQEAMANTEGTMNVQPDFSHLQRTDQTWQQEDSGPQMSEKLPTTQLASEYHGGDPGFVEKVAQIPSVYQHYRKSNRDGSCGFRTAIYGYAEGLLKSDDASLVQSESRRFYALKGTMNQQCPEATDWIDEQYEEGVTPFFEGLASWYQLPADDAAQRLHADFNDADRNMPLRYLTIFMRYLAVTELRSNAAIYSQWLDDMTPFQDYTEKMLMDEEIDDLAFAALYGIFLKPVRMNLEILQLVRSTTSDPLPRVSYQTEGSWYTIRTLYRPGHYDLIYPFEAQSPNTSVFGTRVPADSTSFDDKTALLNNTPWMLGPVSTPSNNQPNSPNGSAIAASHNDAALMHKLMISLDSTHFSSPSSTRSPTPTISVSGQYVMVDHSSEGSDVSDGHSDSSWIHVRSRRDRRAPLKQKKGRVAKQTVNPRRQVTRTKMKIQPSFHHSICNPANYFNTESFSPKRYTVHSFQDPHSDPTKMPNSPQPSKGALPSHLHDPTATAKRRSAINERCAQCVERHELSARPSLLFGY